MKSSRRELVHHQFMEHLKISTEDIRYSKRQQWSASFYGILLQGGLISLMHLIFENLNNNDSYINNLQSPTLLQYTFIILSLIIGYIIMILLSMSKVRTIPH
jgi:uncharacterized integral membrane protein